MVEHEITLESLLTNQDVDLSTFKWNNQSCQHMINHFNNEEIDLIMLNLFKQIYKANMSLYYYFNIELMVKHHCVNSFRYVLKSPNFTNYQLDFNEMLKYQCIDLFLETQVTDFKLTILDSKELIDFLIAINYEFKYLYVFKNVEVLQYLMNQVNYQIDMIDENNNNIYYYNSQQYDVFVYIHQTYGHLLDLNQLSKYDYNVLSCIDDEDLLIYLIKNGADYNYISKSGSIMITISYMSIETTKFLLTYDLCRPILLVFLRDLLIGFNDESVANQLLDRLNHLSIVELNMIFSELKSNDETNQLFRKVLKILKVTNLESDLQLIDTNILTEFKLQLLNYYGLDGIG